MENYSKKKQVYKKNSQKNPNNTVTTVVGKCYLCQSGVSNISYAMQLQQYYIHFECILKLVKKNYIEQQKNSQKFNVTYLGSSTFLVYKQEKGKWIHLKKYLLTDLIKI